MKPVTNPKRRSAPSLLFAYGANMNPAWLAERGIRAEALAVACLPDHRLSFHGYTKVWDGAEEAVISAPGHELWGVVYKLSGMDADRLDAAQGVRLNGTGTYFHSPAEVIAEDGAAHSVVLFHKAALRDARPPSAEYLAYIVEGAKARGLPAAYVEALGATPSVPAAYPVPLKPKAGPNTIISACAC